MPLRQSPTRMLSISAPAADSRSQAKSVTSSTPPANCLLAETEQEFQAYVEADETGHVHRSALIALGSILEIQLDAGEIAIVGHAVPANTKGAEQIEVLAARRRSLPLGPQQPLVTVGRQEVDRRVADIQGKHTKPLDGIQKQQNTTAMHHFCQPVQVVPPAAGVGDPTDTDNPRAVVACPLQCLHRHKPPF